MDTTNILFICGGAFVGLEKVIGRRAGRKSMGFLHEEDKEQQRDTHGKALGMSGRRDIGLLEQVQPVDLIKFGFIPEFIGRMPVVAVLEDLDKQALVQILSKPKNAIVRQSNTDFTGLIWRRMVRSVRSTISAPRSTKSVCGYSLNSTITSASAQRFKVR